MAQSQHPRLGNERMRTLREKVSQNRALTENAVPYTDEDMKFEPLDADTLARVKKVSRKAR